jgi:Flp pilus assembly pilin Flp
LKVVLKAVSVVFLAIWKLLRKDELGQDLSEYCLLTALIALVALGIIFQAAGGIDGIWGGVNARVASGNHGTGTGTARTRAH